MFYDVLERKNVLLGHKNKKLKNLKIVIFPKELVHGFALKLALFSCCYVSIYKPVKCVL